MLESVSVNFETYKLTRTEVFNLHPHEYWYLAPTQSDWLPMDGNIPWTKFALLLHNTKLGKGLCIAQNDLLSGISVSINKTGSALKAEELIECVRESEFPSKPSRLRAHYLNYSKSAAQKRAHYLNWQSRRLTPCYVMLDGGKFHYARMSTYEKLCADPENIALARSYWNDIPPDTEEGIDDLEVIADSCLYFPEWESFPIIDIDSLIAWQNNRDIIEKSKQG